jgi:ZIP family zinc transporter
MNNILILSIIGGLVSALSTGFGSILAPIFSQVGKLKNYHMSMDFALGVMLSAVAFSLVGPELVKGHALSPIFSGLLAGSLFILVTHKAISATGQSHKLLLISALIFHNFPEGMGAGASLAGMSFHEALPVQVALSIQNIAEGLLLTLLLQGMGLSLKASVIGGLLSGVVELSGAVAAGFFLQDTTSLLPFFLALAGGAMMMSVGLELYEAHVKGKIVHIGQMASGLLLIPVTNYLLQ